MKYNTMDFISKEDKLIKIIKQSRSFKSLVSSFENDEEVKGDVIELAFTRIYPKPEPEFVKVYDADCKGVEIVQPRVVSEREQKSKESVEQRIKDMEFVRKVKKDESDMSGVNEFYYEN